jgi:hypothetical protein
VSCKFVHSIPKGIVEHQTSVHTIHAFMSIWRDCVGLFRYVFSHHEDRVMQVAATSVICFVHITTCPSATSCVRDF